MSNRRQGSSSGVSRREVLVVGAATGISVVAGVFAAAWRLARGPSGPQEVTVPSTPQPRPQPETPAAPTPTAISPPPEEPPPPQQDVVAAPEETITLMEVLCRDSWRAAPAGVGRAHAIRQITVHHSAAALTDNRQVPRRIHGFQQHHQSRGWPDIAYHYVVDAQGNIYEARSPEFAGDTATDYDPSGHFLALCDGNFEEHDVPQAQLDGLARLLAWAVQHYGLSVDLISGHKDHAATACPGTALYARLMDGELVQRVSAYLAAGPLSLHLICGAEATERVNAIERGV